jgi:hypothetical protein
MENVVVNSEVVAEAQVAEAQVAEAQVAEAQVAEAQVAEAQVAEAQVAEVEPCEIRCKVLRVTVEDFNDEDTIRLVIDRKVNGFIKTNDNAFTAAEVDYIRFRQSALTAQLCAVSEEFAMYRSLQKGRLSQKQLAVLLAQAKIGLSQTLVLAGEPYNADGEVKDHDIYVNTIQNVQFNKNVLDVFASLTERVLFGALDL